MPGAISAGVQFAFEVKDAIKNMNIVQNNFGGMTKALQRGGQQICGMVVNVANRFANLSGLLVKVGLLAATYLGGKAVGGIIEAGQAAENQLVMLETAVGDATRAFDLYQEAVARADVTPFETNEVVESVVKLQAYGIEAFGKIKDTGIDAFTAVGNMAGAMGKSIDQSMEAVADAVQGELERLKEFGISAKTLPPELKNMEKGTDEYKEAMLEFIATIPRFQGGMEKMSKTMTGLISTVRGFASNFVRMISGVGDAMAKKSKITTFYDEVKATVKDFLDFLVKNRDMIMNFARAIGQVLRVIWTVVRQLLGLVTSAIGSIIGSFGAWWDEMGKGEEAFRVFATKAAAFSIFLEILFEDIAATLEPLFNIIGRIFDLIGAGMKQFASGLIDVLAEEAPKHIKNIINDFAECVDQVWLANDAVEFFMDLFRNMGEIVGAAINLFLTVIEVVVHWVKEFVIGVKEAFSFVGGLGDAINELLGIIKEIIQEIGLAVGETKDLGAIFRFVGKIVGTVLVVGFKILIGALKIVANIVLGLIKFIKILIKGIMAAGKAIGKAFKAVGNAAGKVADFVTDKWNRFKGVFADLGRGISESMGQGWNLIKSAAGSAFEWIKEKWEGLKTLFSNLGGWLAKPFKAAFDFLKTTMMELINWFIDKYNWLADSAVGKRLGLTKIDPISIKKEDVVRPPGGTKNVTHHSSPVINVYESANAKETAAYVVNFMDRRFAEGR